MANVAKTAALEQALAVEEVILRELKAALLARWQQGKRDDFLRELRSQVRTQGFRIAALKRRIAKI